MAFDPQMFNSGLGGLFGGLFGNSGKSYQDAMDQYNKYMNKGEGVQQPYTDAGKNAVGEYQNWLNGQKDPTKFINDIMGQYNESPYAHNLQQQSINAGTNAASASGLTGSTPFAQQLQQNAGKISSEDQNQWLQNVLGINKQYGEGENNLVTGGRESANKLTDMYNNYGTKQGEAAYGKTAGKQQDFWNTIGGGLGVLGSFL